MPSTSACLAAILLEPRLDEAQPHHHDRAGLPHPALPVEGPPGRGDGGAARARTASTSTHSSSPTQWTTAPSRSATSHVFFTTGAIQDLAVIADIARRAGAYSLIDGYQGAGQVPVDLPSTGVDFYTAGPAQMAMRRPGARLPLRARRVDHQPWSPPSRAGSRARTSSTSTPATSATTPTPAASNSAPLRSPPCTRRSAARRSSTRSGWRRFGRRNVMLTDRLVDGARAAGFSPRVSDAPSARSAVITIRHPDPAPRRRPPRATRDHRGQPPGRRARQPAFLQHGRTRSTDFWPRSAKPRPRGQTHPGKP